MVIKGAKQKTKTKKTIARAKVILCEVESMEISKQKMRRSGTLGDFSQSVQPQKKSFRKCYSETALGSINPANSDKPPKHPLLGIDVSVFMRPSSNRPADVLQYPQTPREVSLSPTNAFKRSPQQVPSSPSDIPIPPIPKPLLRTKDTEAIQRSSSSESLSSMFEKSTIHGRIGKLPHHIL